MNRAIFFDRDGVLNKLINRDDGWYSPRKLANFEIISNSIEALYPVAPAHILPKHGQRMDEE